MANKWRYECDCHNCANVEYVFDPANSRDGDYCIPGIMGKKTVHADDDYVIRCDYYSPKVAQLSFMEV
jgi:hypothetical protein